MHPILFEIGDFFIGTYGLFVALGLLAGLFVSNWMARKNAVDPNVILDLALIGVVSGIIGARLTYISVNFEDFLRQPMAYVFTRQGFVFGGGMIFAVVAAIIYLRKKKERVWKVADVIAPAIPLGHGIGRIGCFMAGCCWGKRCELPWGVQFPKATDPSGNPMGFAYVQHLEEGWIDPSALQSLRVHPVQLYEALILFVLSAILFFVWRKRKFSGQVFLTYLLAYPIIRFVLEYFRGDLDRGIYGWFSTSQYLSLGVFVAAIVIWMIIRNRPIEETALPVLEDSDKEVSMAGKARKRRAK